MPTYVYFVFIITAIFFGQSIHCIQLKYVWGDAMDDPLAPGPDGGSYPWDMASKFVAKQRSPRGFDLRGENKPSQQHLLSPHETRKILMNSFQGAMLTESSEKKLEDTNTSPSRQGRSNNVKEFRDGENENCESVPSRLCPSTYNTTAPLYGVSLTSGRPVTIVQKFPDLLQQVVFQVCKTEKCDLLHGECVQNYLPYLFLVIPLGPVTLTGQDYILIESGCVCQPKYAKKYDAPPPLPFVQSIRS